MKDAIIAKLKAKFPKLSDARIAAIAAKMEPKVTEEKDIDDKIVELDEIMDFASIIKQDAKVAKLEAEKKEAGKKKPEDKKEDAEPEGEDDEPVEPKETTKKERVPAYMKGFMESVKNLTEKVSALESEKTDFSIKKKISEKLKDVPAKYWAEWKRPEKEEEIDAFVERVTTGHEGYMNDLKKEGFINSSMPKSGIPGSNTSATPAEIKAITDKIIK